jgi:hypothetical protein
MQNDGEANTITLGRPLKRATTTDTAYSAGSGRWRDEIVEISPFTRFSVLVLLKGTCSPIFLTPLSDASSTGSTAAPVIGEASTVRIHSPGSSNVNPVTYVLRVPNGH